MDEELIVNYAEGKSEQELSDEVRANDRQTVRESSSTLSVGFGGPKFTVSHPAHVIFNCNWGWAREGSASCSIDEVDYDHFISLSATPKAQGVHPDTAEDNAAVRSVMTHILHSLTKLYLDQGCKLVSLDSSCAILTKPYPEFKFRIPLR